MDEACQQMKADDIRRSPEYQKMREALGLKPPERMHSKLLLWMRALLMRLGFR